MKRILVLTTGGTIAGVQKEQDGAYQAGVLAPDRLLSSVALPEYISVDTDAFCSLDSNDLTFGHLSALYERLCRAQDEYDGIVITHGTDTMEETAFFLSLVLRPRIPVVFTGAMRPATALSADGPANLKNAVVLAASSASKNYGILCCMNDTIFCGHTLHKTNSFLPHAMDGVHLGYFRGGLPYFTLPPLSTPAYFPSADIKKSPAVSVAYAGLEMSPAVLFSLAEFCRGIILAGTGDGCFSTAWADAVCTLSQQGTVFVRSSRCTQSLVVRNLGMPDDELGTIPAGSLNPQKARILLSLALQQDFSFEQICSLFTLF